MSDIFEETEEEQRNQAYMDMAKKSAPYLIGLFGGALAIALGYWGFTSWQLSTIHKSSEIYSSATEHLKTDKRDEARKEFEGLTKSGSESYKAMAMMNLAALSLDDDKPKDALALYEKAQKTAKSPVLSDLAGLRAAYIALDSESLEAMQTRLKPLIDAKRPYSALAREALALAKIQAGDLKGARSDLTSLNLMLGLSEGVKARTQAYIIAIDSGSAETARLVAKEKVAEFNPALLGAGLQ